MEERARFKKLVSLATLLVFTGAAFLFGITIGYKNKPEALKALPLVNVEPMMPTTAVDFEPFWKTWNLINEKYVSIASTTSEQERVWGAIEGLVESLADPYSVFLPPEDSETFAENISGNFGGVGMEIGMRDEDKILTVIAPLKNTPAEKAGILSGDKIILIDDTPTADLSVDEAVRLIRGEVGTNVVLTIERKSVKEPFKITVTRAIITIPTIDTEKRADGVFVIKLYNFSGNSTNAFRQALREFVLSGTDKLVIDVRGNTGGFLEAAVDISSWFLPAGKVVVTEDFGGRRENVVHRSKGYDIFNENLKLVILVNSGSASATEIFAGALSEHGKAKLVGEKTFGKGSVQELISVTNDTSLKITIAHWLTPNGKSFSNDGLVPDYIVPMTGEDRVAGRDPQLDKAVALLLAQ